MKRSEDQFELSDVLYSLLVNLMYCILTGEGGVSAPVLGIPGSVFSKYLDLLSIWNKIYDITKNKSGATPTDRAARDTAKFNLTEFLRTFVKKYLYANMPPCTNEIIISCGMKPHATTRTSQQGAPLEIPSFGAKPNASHGFDCRILNEENKVAKPDRVAIMRIRYFIGSNPPKDPAEFAKFQDYSRIPIVLNLPADSAGNDITMACCYVNSAGEEGNYSNIITTKIP